MEHLSEATRLILSEIDAAFSTRRWQLLDTGTERVQWLAYNAAALRHCAQLLREIEAAVQSGQELAVRLLGRAHMEAWLVCLYIHFGGYPAVRRLAQAARHGLEGIDQEAKDFDEWLATAKKAARKRVRKVERANSGIAKRNESAPDKPPTPPHAIPHVPQLTPTGLDLDAVIASFGELEAQGLPVSEIIDSLSKWAPQMGFGKENFRPLYLIYRVMSVSGTHTTKSLLDTYFLPFKPGGFIKVSSAPANGSMIETTFVTAVYSTAYAATNVLAARDCPRPVCDTIEEWLRPDPSGRSAWAPGG
ncbi:hypothetical protein BG452_17270 [Streptomyces sp. CBMA123]|nr:hypothetical protein [Streptomyces sp. CBMA123]